MNGPEGLRFIILLEISVILNFFLLIIDIALFSDDPENLLAEDFVIYSQKHQIVSGTNAIELKVKEKPVYAGVDPYIKLVDKDSKNNLAKF